ncbi:MAG: YggS family pyridoxal phosphate-dependent enzyme [Spartobacteria bacterium]
MSKRAENLAAILSRIDAVAGKHGRKPGEVRLVAVSKTNPAEAIREVFEAGQRAFGESRVQEALPKLDALPPEIEWHFIGHLQTNKIRKVVGRFALFHGVDNQNLAQQMSRIAGELGVTANVLLEVNVSGEESKFGFDPKTLPAALEALLPLPYLRIQGLMTMAPYSEDHESARPYFAKLRELRDRLAVETGNPLRELSMGMSGDFEQGIAEGATIVRVGSAIFGERA